MPHFSNWRAMFSSGSNENRERSPGQRPGGAATCRARLKGWLRNVADRSPIWGDVDLAAFCRITGYSRERTTRELSRIRREDEDLAFETKLRDKKTNGRRNWGVIVADPAKLKFDKCSLFYDAQGCRLHNYTTLAAGGAKMEPTIVLHPPSPHPRGRPRKHFAPSAKTEKPRACHFDAQAPANAGGSVRVLDSKGSEENTGGCDIPYNRKGFLRNTAAKFKRRAARFSAVARF